MNGTRKENIILWFSLPLVILVTTASVIALITPGFYALEKFNWQVQSMGQDLVDLVLIIPVFVISTVLAAKGKKGFCYIWAGVMAYLIYTFLIYAVSIHFNKLFLVYCLSLGLSFFSLAWFLYSRIRKSVSIEYFGNISYKITGIYFIAIAAIFYLLWLTEVLPATLTHNVPKSVTDTGLFTNIVHVLDLSIVLPAIMITGILILKRKQLGYVLAPVLLSFFTLMNITISVLIKLMKQRGLEGSYAVSIVMILLAISNLILLSGYIKKASSLSIIRSDSNEY